MMAEGDAAMQRLIDTPRTKHPLNLSRMNKLEDQLKDMARGFDRLGHQGLAQQADRVAAEMRTLWGMVLETEAAEYAAAQLERR